MNKATEMYADRCGTHPPFSLNLGDRCKRTLEEAQDLAARREYEQERGPQTVIQHNSWLLKGVWFVQDAR